MKLTILGSGSKGNATVLQKNNKSILIDAGFHYKELTRRMHERGIRPDSIIAILITHEHIDHTRGLGAFTRIHRVPVYINEGTFENLLDDIKADIIQRIEYFSLEAKKSSPLTFTINNITVTRFPVPHDAASPVGYTFSSAGQKISYVTDLGSITDSVIENLSGSSLIVLEANHDKTMLQQGKYPDYLKQRIAGPYGHLSNDDACEILLKVLSAELQTVYLAHLSQENNRPELAYQAVKNYLAERFQTLPQIRIAYQNESTQTDNILLDETVPVKNPY